MGINILEYGHFMLADWVLGARVKSGLEVPLPKSFRAERGVIRDER